jgi:hypothetical protein
MNIFNSSFVNHSLSVLKENIYPHLDSAWGAQQKRIFIIASAVFTLLAAYFLIHYCIFNRRKDVKDQGETKVSSATKQEESANPTTVQVFQKALTASPLPVNDMSKAQGEVRIKIPTPQRADARFKSPGQSLTPTFTPKREDRKIDENSKSSPYSVNDWFDDPFDLELNEALSDVSDDDGEDESSEVQSGPQQVFTIEGKLVSLRTIKCWEKLDKELEKLGKKRGKAIDNGDCFWDSFAKTLTLKLGRTVTIAELRQKVSEEVKRLDQGPDEENWVKKGMRGDSMDTYPEYRDRVAYTCSEALEQKLTSPIWGRQNRDGVILCHHYKVNLRVYSVGCIDEHPSKMEDEENFYWGEDDFPKGQPYSETIEMAIYPGHFVPVFNKDEQPV